MNKLIIFTGPYCPKCKTLKEVLNYSPPKNAEVVYEDTSVDLTLARQYNIRKLPSVLLVDETNSVISSITGGDVTLNTLRGIGIEF